MQKINKTITTFLTCSTFIKGFNQISDVTKVSVALKLLRIYKLAIVFAALSISIKIGPSTLCLTILSIIMVTMLPKSALTHIETSPFAATCEQANIESRTKTTNNFILLFLDSYTFNYCNGFVWKELIYYEIVDWLYTKFSRELGIKFWKKEENFQDKWFKFLRVHDPIVPIINVSNNNLQLFSHVAKVTPTPKLKLRIKITLNIIGLKSVFVEQTMSHTYVSKSLKILCYITHIVCWCRSMRFMCCLCRTITMRMLMPF